MVPLLPIHLVALEHAIVVNDRALLSRENYQYRHIEAFRLLRIDAYLMHVEFVSWSKLAADADSRLVHFKVCSYTFTDLTTEFQKPRSSN
jgi:hypothetical protein